MFVAIAEIRISMPTAMVSAGSTVSIGPSAARLKSLTGGPGEDLVGGLGSGEGWARS